MEAVKAAQGRCKKLSALKAETSSNTFFSDFFIKVISSKHFKCDSVLSCEDLQLHSVNVVGFESIWVKNYSAVSEIQSSTFFLTIKS